MRKLFFPLFALIVNAKFSYSQCNCDCHQIVTQEQYSQVPISGFVEAGVQFDLNKVSVDLSANFPPAQNQGQQSSCVSWAGVYAIKSYQEKIEEGNSYYDYYGNINWGTCFSPSFVHNSLKKGAWNCNTGVQLYDVVNFLKNYGAVHLADFGYNENDCSSQPNTYLFDKAKKYKIYDFKRLSYYVNSVRAEDVIKALNQGYPVLFGIYVDWGFAKQNFNKNFYNAYLRDYVWNGFFVPKYQLSESHAMVVVGYDNNLRAFKVLNSHGNDFGKSGYFWITYDHFENGANDAYYMIDAQNGPKKDNVNINLDNNNFQPYTFNREFNKIITPGPVFNPSPNFFKDNNINVNRNLNYWNVNRRTEFVNNYDAYNSDVLFASNINFYGAVGGNASVNSFVTLNLYGAIALKLTAKSNSVCNVYGAVAGDLIIERGANVKIAGVVVGSVYNYGGTIEQTGLILGEYYNYR